MFFCILFCFVLFCLFFPLHSLLWPCACVCVQDYSEEFRDISSKGKRSGHIPEGAITLLNQRTVGDDLPVMILSTFILHSHTLTHSPIMIPLFTTSFSFHTEHFKTLTTSWYWLFISQSHLPSPIMVLFITTPFTFHTEHFKILTTLSVMLFKIYLESTGKGNIMEWIISHKVMAAI